MKKVKLELNILTDDEVNLIKTQIRDFNETIDLICKEQGLDMVSANVLKGYMKTINQIITER